MTESGNLEIRQPSRLQGSVQRRRLSTFHSTHRAVVVNCSRISCGPEVNSPTPAVFSICCFLRSSPPPAGGGRRRGGGGTSPASNLIYSFILSSWCDTTQRDPLAAKQSVYRCSPIVGRHSSARMPRALLNRRPDPHRALFRPVAIAGAASSWARTMWVADRSASRRSLRRVLRATVEATRTWMSLATPSCAGLRSRIPRVSAWRGVRVPAPLLHCFLRSEARGNRPCMYTCKDLTVGRLNRYGEAKFVPKMGFVQRSAGDVRQTAG